MPDIERSKSLHCYGKINSNGITYKIIIGHPYDMLKDEYLSWESKGYLSYIIFIEKPEKPETLPIHILNELKEFGYLVEVTE